MVGRRRLNDNANGPAYARAGRSVAAVFHLDIPFAQVTIASKAVTRRI